MNKKVIGYIIALIGLAILIFGAGGLNIPFISSIDNYIISIVAMIFVGIGVVLVIMEGGGRKSKYQGKRHSKSGGKIQDLPVYEGDNIIAYRRD